MRDANGRLIRGRLDRVVVMEKVLDQPENKEVRELYVNPEALKNLKAGQPLPSGTVLSAPTFKARKWP